MQIPNPFNYLGRDTEAEALNRIAGDNLTSANYEILRSKIQNKMIYFYCSY